MSSAPYVIHIFWRALVGFCIILTGFKYYLDIDSNHGYISQNLRQYSEKFAIPGLLNVYVRLPINFINGFAFGMTYNLIVGMVMNKFFSKTNKITPITLYNLGLSIGICSSQFFNTFMKEDVFGDIDK